MRAKKAGRGFCRPLKLLWQRPTFPRSKYRSIIGDGGLNCRVRNGTGCISSSMVARKFDGCGGAGRYNLYANSSGAPKIYNLDSFSIWRRWKYFCSRRVPLCTLPRSKIDFRLVRYLTVLQIRIELPILKFSDLFQAIINLLTVESGGFNSGRFCFAASQSGGLRAKCTLWYMTRASRDFNHATEQNQLNFS